MKNKGFGHLKTRLVTIETSKNAGLGAHGNYTPLKLTGIAPARLRHLKTTAIFQPSIFMCKLAVSFREGKYLIINGYQIPEVQ